MFGQRSVIPSYPPEDQPPSRGHSEIHRFHGTVNRRFDVPLVEFTHGEPEQGVGHTTDLIPEKRLPFYLKTHQAVAVHPGLGVKNRSHRVFAFFETCKVSCIVGAHEH